MKQRITISIDEELILKVREAIRHKKFYNKSQAFEKVMRAELE